MTGEAATIAALLLVVLVAQILGVLDLGSLFENPGEYAKHHPGKVVGCGVIALGLSYVLADTGARLLYRKQPGRGVYKQHTIWYDAFEVNRPDGAGVLVTAELNDGFQISGALRRFTAEDCDDRELELALPIATRRPGGKAEMVSDGDFLILRESQLKYAIGQYVPAIEDPGRASTSAG